MKFCNIRIIPNIDPIKNDEKNNNKNEIMQKIFFGKYYNKFNELHKKYSNQIFEWSQNKLIKMLYNDNNIKNALIYSQQIFEDMFMEKKFF